MSFGLRHWNSIEPTLLPPCWIKPTRLSGNSLWRLSKKISDFLETFQCVQKIFQTLLKPSRKSWNFLDCPKTLQTVYKLSRLSGNFPIVCKLSRLSGNFPDCPETFQSVRKLKVQNKGQFCSYAPKNSSLQCWRAVRVFLLLGVPPHSANMFMLLLWTFVLLRPRGVPPNKLLCD